MLFLTIKLTNKAEINILLGREQQGLGAQASASWVMMLRYIRKSIARIVHLGLQNQPLSLAHAKCFSFRL